MSSANKKSSAYHGTSNDSKPRYVKKLNFGQRLGHNLKIHQPCLETVAENSAENSLNPDKEWFVSQWLNKYEDDFFKENNIVYPTSPVLSSSFTKRTPRSPNLGNSRKRLRRGYSSGENSSRNPNPLDGNRLKKKNDSVNSSFVSNQTQQSGSRVEGKYQEENLHQPLFLPESPSSSYVNKSPVLTGKMRLRKFREKRLCEEKNKTKSIKLEESLKLEDNAMSKKDARLKKSIKLEEADPVPSFSVIMETPDKKSNSLRNEDETFFEETEVVEEKFIEKIKENVEKIAEEDLHESQIFETCKETHFHNYKLGREIFSTIDAAESESSLKENLLIEIKSSKVVRDNQSILIDDETETEETASYFIEDADTPDVVFVNNVKRMPIIVEEKVPVPHKSPSKDSDETFFSRAGSFRSQIMQSSQKISQISSSKIKSNSLSQINNVISVDTSSPKPVMESFVNMLKTEKKKRKVKKGSLVAKLQTVINTEISFMRMWQHQISKPTFQNINVQFVDLCIQQYYNSYNRQFTECHLIADSYNLLKNILKLETEQDADFQSVNNSKRTINRTITIMTIPEVVGELKAEKGKRLKIFPPWEILDQENLVLSVTYFDVDERINFEVNNEKSVESVKSKRIEKFDCICIQEGKVVEDCTIKFNNRKPNVIQEMFNTSK